MGNDKEGTDGKNHNMIYYNFVDLDYSKIQIANILAI